jgi:hypothetical protein
VTHFEIFLKKVDFSSWVSEAAAEFRVSEQFLGQFSPM